MLSVERSAISATGAPVEQSRHTDACRRSKIRQMRRTLRKDAALLAQKWRETNCKPNPASLHSTKPKKLLVEKIWPIVRKRLHESRPTLPAPPRNALILRHKDPHSPQATMAAGLLALPPSHAHVRPPAAPGRFCSEFRTDLPNQFQMAFCCCKLLMFLYIEGLQGRSHWKHRP